MKTLALSFILFISITAKAQNARVDKIAESYIALKNALVASNATLAKSRSAELLSALSSPIANLKPAQQKRANVYFEKLKYNTRHISQTTEIDHQREHFQSLSKNLYALLSELKLNSQTLYQQYCPMKKASWLSETEDIRNPYYGDDMLECGKITATLNSAGK